jgi:hypothetical protein
MTAHLPPVHFPRDVARGAIIACFSVAIAALLAAVLVTAPAVWP